MRDLRVLPVDPRPDLDNDRERTPRGIASPITQRPKRSLSRRMDLLADASQRSSPSFTLGAAALYIQS